MLAVFKAVALNPTHHFFGVTGDIDDLGIFVAQYGRAHAENLVDYISAITEDYFLTWREHHDTLISSFAIVLGGEEMLVLGTSKEGSPLNEMFRSCRHDVNGVLSSDQFFPLGNLTISFGCALFRQDDLMPMINQLLAYDSDGVTTYSAYIEVMYTVRRVLSVCLDLQKFGTFQHESPELAIAYRNLVYFDLLRHKERSKTLLALAANSWEASSHSRPLRDVWDDYGMLNGRQESMALLVKALET